MNKKLHFLLFCLLLIIIVYLCKDKLLEPFGKLEPFGNQIVIHPDNAELNPRETTFSVLTYDSDLDSGYTQASICSDDSSWKMGEKTCRDYSLTGSNCEDIGDDGRLAFDACKVACDNCNTYTEIKRRLPSPIEDTDEPSYAQFEGGEDGDFGGIGGVDIREILGKLDDLKSKMDLIILDGGGGGGGGGGAAVAAAAAAATAGGGGGGDGPVVPLPPIVPSPPPEDPVVPAPSVRTGYCSDNTDTDAEPDIVCTGDYYSDNPNNSTIKSRVRDECCYTKGWCKGNTDPNSEDEIICTPPGYTDKIGKEAERGTTPEECCEKTGFCSGNTNPANDTDCPDGYTDKPGKNGLVGSGLSECCNIVPAPTTPTPPETTTTPTTPKEDNTLRNILIVAIIAVVVGIIAGIYMMSDSGSGSKSELKQSLLDNEYPSGGMFGGMTILS